MSTVDVIHTEHTEVRQLGYGWLEVKSCLRVRTERECWKCGGKYAASRDGRLSIVFTSRGNKIICTDCADDLIKQGVTWADKRPKEGA
jgi:hypothetical protein